MCSGRAERIGVSVSSVSDPNAIHAMDSKLLEKSFSVALQFPVVGQCTTPYFFFLPHLPPHTLSMRSVSDVNQLLCAWCGRGGVVSPCSGCGLASYCDVQCQKNHWKLHKTACKAARSSAVATAPKPAVPAASAQLTVAGAGSHQPASGPRVLAKGKKKRH